jgi:hypothetical protein
MSATPFKVKKLSAPTRWEQKKKNKNKIEIIFKRG